MINSNRTVTVFGGTGFLGRHIVWALAKTGVTIRVATRVRERAYFLRPAGTVGQIVPVACDVRDEASVAAALAGATDAVNLIGILNETRAGSFPQIHIDTAERIARAARAERLNLLVHVSALGASAAGPSKYARTKAEGENRVIHAFSQSVILRPSVVFGPEDNFFNMFARMARVSPWLPLIGGGKTRFQPVYVADIAKAVRNILADPAPEKYFGQIYELGGPVTYTFRELMEVMQRHTGQHARLKSLPVPVAKVLGLFGGCLPGKPLTVDKVRALQKDNVIEPGSPGLKELGVAPTALDSVLPGYLAQYRPGGRFAENREAS